MILQRRLQLTIHFTYMEGSWTGSGSIHHISRVSSLRRIQW